MRPGSRSPSPEPFPLILFLLLLSSVAISYIDRGALSIAAPAMQQELHFGAAELGLLLSAFFWTYALLQPAAGVLLDRYGGRIIFGVAFLLWTLATLSIGTMQRFSGLLLARFLLGAGESVAGRIRLSRFMPHRARNCRAPPP